MDDAEARRILTEHGESPPARARLSAEWRAKALALAVHDSVPDDAFSGDDDDDPGDPGEPSEPAQPTLDDDDYPSVSEASEPPEPPAVQPEARPRRVRVKKPPAGGLGARLRGQRGKGKPKAKARKSTRPRVSTAGLVGTVWAGLGGIVTKFDPATGRTLMMQSVVAGDILDDAVKGTALDPALQFAARNYAAGERVAALVMPPVMVRLLQQADRLDEPARSQRLMLLHPIAVRSFMLWDSVTAAKMEDVLARAEAERPKVEQAERMLNLCLFGTPTPQSANGQAPEPEPEPQPADA